MNPDRSPDDPDRGLDVDAAFAEIIAGWEPSAPEPRDEADREVESSADGSVDPAAGTTKEPPAEPAQAERLRGLFQPSWNDPLDSEATWEDEGHFVPPPPPPLPRIDPHRRLAWGALLGTPLVTLLLIGAGIRVAGWMAFVLALAFIGGFGYLVATMRSGPPDDWSGDDGARI